MYIYIYIIVYLFTCIYIYMYIHIYIQYTICSWRSTDGLGTPRPQPLKSSKLVSPVEFSQSYIFLNWLSGAPEI